VRQMPQIGSALYAGCRCSAQMQSNVTSLADSNCLAFTEVLMCRLMWEFDHSWNMDCGAAGEAMCGRSSAIRGECERIASCSPASRASSSTRLSFAQFDGRWQTLGVIDFQDALMGRRHTIRSLLRDAYIELDER